MLTVKEQKERFEMYLQGKTDQEIGDSLGYSSETIRNWRAERNLPLNYGMEIEISDKYVSNKNRKQNRISFVKNCLKKCADVLKCESVFEVDENTKFAKISVWNESDRENILLLNLNDDSYFITDYDFENYVNSRVKSVMCKFIRKLYDMKGKV